MQCLLSPCSATLEEGAVWRVTGDLSGKPEDDGECVHTLKKTTAAPSCQVTHGGGFGRASGSSKGNICQGGKKDTHTQSLSLICDHMPAYANRSLEATAKDTSVTFE